PRLRRPSALEVELANALAEGQDAVVVPEVVAGHRLRRRHRAMMRIVEQELVPAAGGAMAADARDELVIVPLVHDGEVGAVEGLVEIERVEGVPPRMQARVRPREGIERIGAGLPP